MNYSLSVLSEVVASDMRPPEAVTLVEVFTVTVDRPIEWVKRNADELARCASKREPVALWVEAKGA